MIEGRRYTDGEEPSQIFSKYAGPNKEIRYFYLRLGRILVVDYERYRMKVEWLSGQGSPPWIPLSYPYVGPAGCIGAMPEKYAIGIFMYFDEGLDTGLPVCLGYLPSGLQVSTEYNAVKNMPDAIPLEDERIVDHRFRELAEGDVIIASPLGAEAFFNSNVEIKDSMEDSIIIRPSDQALIMTSLNNYIFADGAQVCAGPIVRNRVPIFDAEGYRIPNNLARELFLPDNREIIYLVANGEEISPETTFYTEYRVSAGDRGDGTLDTNDINSQTVLSNQNPIVTMAMGNYAVATSLGEIDKKVYGKIVRPVLFKNRNDKEGQFNLMECAQNKGIDEVTAIGLAYVIHVHNNDSLFGFDKEGHCFLNLNSSTTANPMGPGRSMSVLASGNLKEIWGTDAEENNSWDLTTKGGVKWNIGHHGAKTDGLSFSLKASSGIKIEAMNNAENPKAETEDERKGYAKEEQIYGRSRTFIQDLDYKEVGRSRLIVRGLKEEEIESGSFHCFNDRTENVMGQLTQTVHKEMQGKFFKKTETITTGSEVEVFAGNIKETIKTFGNRETKLTLGNIKESIIGGNRETSITLGNYKVDIKVGNIEMSTKAGQVKISAALNAALESKIKASVKSLMVELGNSPKNGVVTGAGGGLPSHFDYCTGSPLKGGFTVKSSV